MLLEGIFLPLPTPFHADGRLFVSKLEFNVRRYSLTPASGIVVLGAAGEAATLTDAEAADVLRAAIGAAADEKVMLAGVGRESVAATLARAEIAAAAGYDAVAVEGPSFTADAGMALEVETYFRRVADASPLPVVVVSSVDRPLGYERIARLATHPNIIGSINGKATGERVGKLLALARAEIRQVTVTPTFTAVTGRMLWRHAPEGNFVSAASLGVGGVVVVTPAPPALKTRTKQVGFQVLGGATATMLDCWGAGASGAVPWLAACAPQACCEVWQAFRDGDPALALEKQERVREAAALVEGPRGVAALKYGCDLNGYYGGRGRLPILPLLAEERERVERVLAAIKN